MHLLSGLTYHVYTLRKRDTLNVVKYISINKPDKCPKCGSEKIARILYGLPSFSESLRIRINNNEVVLGGCCITGNDPSWKCIDCSTVIFKMEIDLEGSAN
jgi:hypothetical protein